MSFPSITIDIPALFSEPLHERHDRTATSADDVLLGRIFVPYGYAWGAAYKLGVYRWLLRDGVVRAWFKEFLEYWTTVLGQREISLHEFHELLESSRNAYNLLSVPDGDDDQTHFRVWQAPETLFLLFFNIYEWARYPVHIYRFVDHVSRGARICEYGCGIGPLTAAIRRFCRHRAVNVTCADIPTLPFHFARWRFRQDAWVRMLEIGPDDDEPLDTDFDVIFCMTVFEHLPRPLAIARHFHDRLVAGGKLIFDYLETEGIGVDTTAALRERRQVFDFLHQHFDGSLDPTSAGPFVCRKRSL